MLNMIDNGSRVRIGLALATVLSLTACGTIVNSATSRFADSLSAGILGQDDIETVRAGLPAYLLLVDGFVSENPDSEPLLLAGAELYAAYAGGFVPEPERARRLAAKGVDYGRRALCLRSSVLCEALRQPQEQWLEALAQASEKDLPALFGYGASWATWIQANSDDWNAIAEVPKVEAIMIRILTLDEQYRDGWPQLYMGVLSTQLPPAYGGKPEQGRAYFERALELSERKNLMVHVMFASQYARLVFDQTLHDSLLREVLDADTGQSELTLINTLAKSQAAELLAGSSDYF